MGLGFVFKHKQEGWEASNAQYSNIPDFGEDNWYALFFEVLGCPESGLSMPEKDVAEYWERIRLNFQQAIPDYPMLGRIWDFYIDVWYAPEEIEQLRNECFKAQANTSNPTALEGLGLLLQACEKASADQLGIFLAAD